jgi:hypothetical protein
MFATAEKHGALAACSRTGGRCDNACGLVLGVEIESSETSKMHSKGHCGTLQKIHAKPHYIQTISNSIDSIDFNLPLRTLHQHTNLRTFKKPRLHAIQ